MPETEGKTVKISHEKYAKSGIYRLFYCPGCEDFHAFFTHGIPPLHAITAPDPSPTPAQPSSAPPPVGPTVTPAIIQAIPGHYCALTIEDGMLVYGQECSHHLAGHVVPMVDLDQETP